MSAEAALRLLQVVPETTGGIGVHVRMLVEELTKRGHSVTVAAPLATLQRLALEGQGTRTLALPAGSMQHSLHVRQQLRELANAHDVTHAHGVRVGAQTAVAGVRPLVVTWHNAPVGGRLRHAGHAALERITAHRSDVVLGASSDLVLRAHKAGARDARLCELPAPATVTLPPDRDPALHDPPTVLAVARLHRQKRLDLLVAAAASWRGRADSPQVLVAGAGPLADALAAQAARAAAPVRFLGARTDIGSLFADADVIVLASDWEARPFVAQEALRAGVPLVATDVGGVRELVGPAAVLVPPGDAQALRQGIEAVLRDPELRRRLAREGPARAAQWPTPREMASDHEGIYLDVRSRSSSRAR